MMTWRIERVSAGGHTILRFCGRIQSEHLAELENHLRKQIAGLVDAGLATDEAFLVAVKRMGSHDALSREFARAHSNRLWKQLLLVPSDSGELRVPGQTDVIIAFHKQRGFMKIKT